MAQIVQKKGSPDRLSGVMLAYARILPGGPPEKSGFPWEEAVKNNLLVVSGNFVGQASLKDFLRREFGADSGEGLENFANQLREMGSDLPEGLDSDELRRRMEALSNMEIIPVPARIVQFESEREILEEKADVFWVGDFHGVGQAHLAVTSFPILYQAWYREQVGVHLQEEIEGFLQQIASAPPPVVAAPTRDDPVVLHLEGDLSTYSGKLLDLLSSQVVPNLVYNLGNPGEFSLSMRNFRRFMKPYRRLQDIDDLENALNKLRQGDSRQSPIVEQVCRMISAFHHEEFERIPAIQSELVKLRSQSSNLESPDSSKW